MKRKDKDTEALWAEVKRLTLEMSRLQQQYDEQTACVIVHRGSALACSDAMRTAYYDERRRADKLEKRLSAYQKAVNKIDDLIEYSLPMPSNTKAALCAVLANLTDRGSNGGMSR